MDQLPYDELERMIAEAKKLVPLGSRWQHYKSTKYSISDIAILEATNAVAVIYASAEHPAVSFIRPLAIWLETVNWNGQTVPRFANAS